MRLPTFKPNDIDYARLMREWELLDDRNKVLERENAALREDKERLEWLLTDDGGFWVNWMYDKDEWTPELKASRDAIDACRNGRIGREKP